ncbi:MAG TPA: ABC transporter permease [Ktedonobacterales bacterium]|jgi:peptide/nickel transport system permease protein|nr:ABC transporter permease [Ktedonobacterales bacterium]
MSQSPLTPISPLSSAEAAPLLTPHPTPQQTPGGVIYRRKSLGVKALDVLRSAWRAIATNRKVAVGSGVIAVFALVALLGPLFVHRNPLAYSLTLNAPPSAAHWLGTNQGGQDVFAQLIIGARSSVFWAFLTGILVVLISIAVGLVGGYMGGAVDDILSVITNVFLVIPSLPLAIVAVQYFSRATITIAIVVALTNWPWGARVLRAQTLSMRSREFVTAARASGEKTWRIIFAEIFPNEISIVAANFVTTTIQVLLAVAGLEFLGFGDTNTISWGIMLNQAYNSGALLTGSWWWFAPPGLCIALLGAGLALLNFGIDEVADPRLRARRRPLLRRGKGKAA